MRYSVRTLLLVVAMIATFFFGFETRRAIDMRAMRAQEAAARLEVQKLQRSRDELQSWQELSQAEVELLQTQLELLEGGILAKDTIAKVDSELAKAQDRLDKAAAELRRDANSTNEPHSENPIGR
jgi:predicted metal-dependent hydrolase